MKNSFKFRYIGVGVFTLFSVIAFSNYNIEFIQPSIANNDGQILIMLGDAGPYDISISPKPANIENFTDYNGELAHFDGLSAGTYTILITDCTGCEYEEVIILEEKLCDLAILLEDVQHNTVSNDFSQNGSITIALQGDINPEDYSIIWQNENGENIIDNSLILSSKGAGTYTVIVEHMSNPTCKVERTFEIVDCESASDVIDGEINYEPNAPEVSFRIISLEPPSTSTSSDGQINYTLLTNGGDATIQWLDLNEEAIVTNNSVENLVAGTYTYEIHNGCYAVENNTIAINSCAENLELVGSLLSNHVQNCTNDDGDFTNDENNTIIYQVHYNTGQDLNMLNVRVTGSVNITPREFTVTDPSNIVIRDLPLHRTSFIDLEFSDDCGRQLIDRIDVNNLVQESSMYCDPIIASSCRDEFQNSLFRFKIDDKGLGANWFDNSNIIFDQSYNKNWKFCSAAIYWENEQTLFITKRDDGKYDIEGDGHVDVHDHGEYKVAVWINGGECKLYFTVHFGVTNVSGIYKYSPSILGTEATYGFWRGETNINPELYWRDLTYRSCVEKSSEIFYAYFPKDLMNPCSGGGFWRKWNRTEKKWEGELSLVSANISFAVNDPIEFNYDFPDCPNNRVSRCFFPPGSIVGVLANDDLYVDFTYCLAPEEPTIDPSCGETTSTVTENCLVTIYCEDGSIAEGPGGEELTNISGEQVCITNYEMISENVAVGSLISLCLETCTAVEDLGDEHFDTLTTPYQLCTEIPNYSCTEIMNL